MVKVDSRLIGPLKQFRVLGRFTWVFFYVFTVTATIGMYRIYLNRRQIVIPVLFFCGMAFYVLEFYPVHAKMAVAISEDKNPFKLQHVDDDLKEVIDYANGNDYTAILFLPMQHMSSENIMLLGAEQANFDAFMLSYHTNLPLINSISSRMSLDEAIKVNNYFSPGFIEKKFTYDLAADDKILLVKNRDLLEVHELKMIWESDQIFTNDAFAVFDFDQDEWNSPNYFNKIVKQNKEATYKVGDKWRSDTTGVWHYYLSYDASDELAPTQIMGGSGAFAEKKTGWNNILKLDTTELKPDNYVVRFWHDIKTGRPDVLAVVEEAYQDSTKQAEWIASFDVKQPTLIVDRWALVEMEFEVHPDFSSIKLLLTGRDSQEPFVIDELLIQKVGDPALFRKDELNGEPYIIYNNYWINENSFNGLK